MNASSSAILQRLSNYCNVLRDDGMSYGDCVKQWPSGMRQVERAVEAGLARAAAAGHLEGGV